MHLSAVVRLARVKEQTQEWAGEYLERLAGDARKQGVAVQKATVEGRPNAAILQFAEANQVDLIMICTRGRSGFSRWLMGSGADRVVRGATVPVLLVRAAKEKTEAWWEPPSERTCAPAVCWHQSAGRRTLPLNPPREREGRQREAGGIGHARRRDETQRAAANVGLRTAGSE